jgi:phage portal protein BeeE
MSYLIEIEQGLTSLLPRGQEAHFNIEALLRSDTLTRYNAHKLGIEAGFLTIEEVRAIEGLGGIA